MKTQSRLSGILLSYGVTVIRVLSQLLLTSLYIQKLGIEGFGFYQYIYSIASFAIILDFGISAVVNKFYLEYRRKGEVKKAENLLFYCLMLSLFAVLIIFAFGAFVYSHPNTVFGELSIERQGIAKSLILYIICYLATLVAQHFFEGVMMAHEKYVTVKAVSLAQLLLKIALVVMLLFWDIGVLAIAISDFAATFLCLLFSICYSVFSLKIKARYHFYDKELLISIVKLSSALCLQSVILYLNNSIDKFFLGRMIGDTAVSIYAIAMTISTFYDEIPTVIQRLYLPEAVKMVANGADGEALTDLVIKPGRYQFLLCGGIFGGFVLFGRDFIALWSGITTYEPWLIALLLMGASIIPLCQNVSLAILTAMNKRMFRSITLGVAALLNAILTVFLIRRFGIMGAPIGTFLALILCNNILMNVYYKKIGLNIGRMFRRIFKGILPAALITTLLCTPLLLLPLGNILVFILKCLAFVLVYAAALWLIGLSREEKESIQAILHRLIKRHPHAK